MSMSNGVTGGVFATLADLQASKPRVDTRVELNGERYSINASDFGEGISLNGLFANPIEGVTKSLINSTITPITGETRKTSGYTSSGDGGGTQWKFTGVTDQTPSKNPAQLGGAKLTDANGNEWELVDKLDIKPEALGATQGQDSTSIINIALSVASSVTTIENVNYKTSAPIVIPEKTELKGKGIILASHVGSEAISLTGRKSKLSNVTISAEGDRLSSLFDNLSVGVRNTAFSTQLRIKDVSVINQPGHAFYFSTNCPGTIVEQCLASECRGHAFVVDDGTLVGSPSGSRTGIIDFFDNISQNCGGYGFALSPSGGGTAFRIRGVNHEITDCSWNETEMGITMSALSYIKGQNIQLNVCASNDALYNTTTLPNSGNTRYAKSNFGDGIGIAGGQSIGIRECRCLDLVNGITVSGNVAGLTIDNPLSGTLNLDTMLAVGSGVNISSGNINLTTFNGIRPVINDGNELSVIVDDKKRIYTGTSESYVQLGSVDNLSISGGGLQVRSGTSIYLSGEGGAADTLSFISVQGDPALGIPNGATIKLINNNAYSITIQYTPNTAGQFTTKSLANVILSQYESIDFLSVSGVLIEI